MAGFQHFRFEVDRIGVAFVSFDRAGDRVNTLDPDVFEEFGRILDRCESDPAVRAVVMQSAKTDSFIVGGNLQWLRQLKDPEASREVITLGQNALFRVEALWGKTGKPVVAAVHGTCLGGGLEFAMACQSIVATDSDATRFGQPEVRVGLIPGAGGTQRLPARVGVAAALDLILTGRSIRPSRAKAMGLVDRLCSPDDLTATAREMAVTAIGNDPRAGRGVRVRNVAAAAGRALEATAVGRRVIYGRAEKSMLKATKGLYPAQPAALRAIRAGVERGADAGYEAEANEFADLLASDEAAGLISLFFATQENKGRHRGPARDVSTVAVVGGGLMGAGIASVSVTRAGTSTVIKELDGDALARAMAHVGEQIEISAKRTRTPAAHYEALFDGTTDTADIGGADLVIEAVFEDLELKRSVLAEVEQATGPDTVFATNTSSIPIANIAAGAARPGNVVGMHYFSPVEKMPLLEVVAAPTSTAEAIATAVAVGRKQGKTVIVVADGPGFYTTRILTPYGAEVMHLLEEGATIEDIDGAMVEWGFPVGPLTLNDEVGLDVAAKIAPVMQQAFGARVTPGTGYDVLVADGRMGRKNERGFYRYEQGKRVGVDQTVYEVLGTQPSGAVSRGEIRDRLVAAMVNEAARCLEEGVLHSAADGDLGAVMGIGFPPFRGGPFFYIDQAGADVIVAGLEQLAADLGSRFAPAQILRDHAESGKPFRR